MYLVSNSFAYGTFVWEWIHIAQLIRNYNAWEASGGSMGDGSSPSFPNPAFGECVKAVFSYPYGLIGLGLCGGAIAILVFMVMKNGSG